jgi:HPt (histidine-containing phosphotransfer) domain-containing protein
MDLSKLRAICADGDHVDEILLVQLLSIFLMDNGVRVDDLCQAAATGQVEHVRRLAHTLAGSAGTAGAMTLAALAKTIEADATAGQRPSPSTVSSVQQEFRRVETIVRTSYPALGAPAT